MFFVFIRTYHVIDMIVLVLFAPLKPGSPELGCIHQKLIAAAIHEILVAGYHIILPDSISHICCNMLFNKTRPNLSWQSRYNICRSPDRRHLSVIQPGRFPRKLGSFVMVSCSQN